MQNEFTIPVDNKSVVIGSDVTACLLRLTDCCISIVREKITNTLL